MMGILGGSGGDDDQAGLLLSVLAAAGAHFIAGATPNPVRLIFRTANHHPGNMPAGGGGVNGADAICALEATNLGYAGTYKALIGTERTAATPRFVCLNPNCSPSDAADWTNWVLGANVDYYRASDNVFITTTTANRNFTFPLANGFSELTGTTIRHWSGVHTDWRSPSGAGGAGFANNDFTGWTTTVGNGWIGDSNDVNVRALATVTSAGVNDTNMHLVCVGQL